MCVCVRVCVCVCVCVCVHEWRELALSVFVLRKGLRPLKNHLLLSMSNAVFRKCGIHKHVSSNCYWQYPVNRIGYVSIKRKRGENIKHNFETPKQANIR